MAGAGLITGRAEGFLESLRHILDEMWAYKSEIMQKIIEADGGNWYNQRRGTDARGRKRPRGVRSK